MLRVVALSGGFSREEACRELAQEPRHDRQLQPRACSRTCAHQQSDEEFNRTLGERDRRDLRSVAIAAKVRPDLGREHEYRSRSTFPPPERTEPAKLYLISPQEVGGAFPDRLKAALEPGIAAAFQLRVKDVDEHELARLAEPLQRICADADVAFIVNDSMALAKRLGADGVHSARATATSVKRGRCSVRRADRQDLPRQPPSGDGSRGGGRGLCRVRRLLSDHDQAVRTIARTRRS